MAGYANSKCVSPPAEENKRWVTAGNNYKGDG